MVLYWISGNSNLRSINSILSCVNVSKFLIENPCLIDEFSAVGHILSRRSHVNTRFKTYTRLLAQKPTGVGNMLVGVRSMVLESLYFISLWLCSAPSFSPCLLLHFQVARASSRLLLLMVLPFPKPALRQWLVIFIRTVFNAHACSYFRHGPALMGVFINVMLYGIVVAQTFFYFVTYKRFCQINDYILMSLPEILMFCPFLIGISFGLSSTYVISLSSYRRWYEPLSPRQ